MRTAACWHSTFKSHELHFALRKIKMSRQTIVNSLIGQFGVGFYSAFLVANRVVVSTKSPWSDKQYVWEAVADSSSYEIKEETYPEKLLRRGTQITLYLRVEKEEEPEEGEEPKADVMIENS